MSLIKCPECSKEVSEQTEFCPNCGYPIKQKKDKRLKKKIIIFFFSIFILAGISTAAFWVFKPAEKNSVNISECMFDYPPSQDICIKELGSPNEQEIETDGFRMKWNNYKLVDDYEGGLEVRSYTTSYEGDVFYWVWETSCGKSDYEKILSVVEKDFGKDIEIPRNEGELHFFRFLGKEGNYEPKKYSPFIMFRDVYEETIMIVWGSSNDGFYSTF